MLTLVKRPRPLAILAALAGFAAALGLGYLLLAYLLFDLFGESWLNRKPERFVIGWRSAKMVAPGEFAVEGLTLRGRTQQVLWSATLEEARLRLDLVALLAREIHFESADGRGLDFQLRRLQAEASDGEGLPPIAAFVGELLVPATSGRPRWALTIDSFTFTEVRELWVDQTRYQAESLEGRMTGALELRMRQSVELPALAAELPAGKLTLKNDRLAQIDALKVRGTLEPTLSRRPQVDLLRNLRLEIDAEASRGDIGVFQHHLRGAPIELDGEGRLAAHIVLADGDLAPGTRLDLAGGNLELRYFGYHGRGRGHAELLVQKAVDGPRESRLEAVLDDFEVGLDGDTEPHLKGQGLRLLAQSADFEVNGRRLPTLLASVELPKTAIPDLAVYNRFLPPRLPFAVRGGRGQVSARFEVDTAKNLGTGRIDLETQGFRAHLEGSTLEGRLRLATRLRTKDLKSRKLTIAGTRLEITGLRANWLPPTKDWWARVDIVNGQVELARPLVLEGEFAAELRDSAPIFALVLKEKPGIGWLENALTMEDLRLESRFRSNGKTVTFEDLEFRAGRRLEVEGLLHLDGAELEGLLHFDYGLLSAGLEIEQGRRDWKLLESRSWYEDRLPLLRRRVGSSP